MRTLSSFLSLFIVFHHPLSSFFFFSVHSLRDGTAVKYRPKPTQWGDYSFSLPSFDFFPRFVFNAVLHRLAVESRSESGNKEELECKPHRLSRAESRELKSHIWNRSEGQNKFGAASPAIAKFLPPTMDLCRLLFG